MLQHINMEKNIQQIIKLNQQIIKANLTNLKDADAITRNLILNQNQELINQNRDFIVMLQHNGKMFKLFP